MGRFKDLTGHTINRWVVLSQDDMYKSPSGRLYVMWLCKCQCGTVRTIRTSKLTSKSSKSRSCGCLSSELVKKRATTHGMSNTREYTTYRAMIKRCYNAKDPAYSSYGCRGIRVCKRWRSSFENFFSDMGERPDGKSIDRINVNGDYEPSNCKWSTKSEQQLNRRKIGKTSKYRGVCYCSHYNKYIAQVAVKVDGKSKNKKIGSYSYEIDAALAYNSYVINNNLPNILNNAIREDHKKENRAGENGKKF